MKRIVSAIFALALFSAGLDAQGLFRPEYLKEGDKVALLSPSYATPDSNVFKAAAVLRSWGLEPVIGSNVGKVEMGQYAGTVEERLADLRTALLDPSIKAIICNRGGYGALHLVDSLRLGEFSAHPKWIVGYSDITTLLAFQNCAGVQGLHGAMGVGIANEPDSLSSTLMRDFLMGRISDYQLHPHPDNIPGKACGILVGGNLCTLTPLLGTRADIMEENDIILFIEEVEESMHNIDRQLRMLKNAGVLSRCRGVILGQFTGCGEEFTCGSVEAMIRPLLEPYGIPVACGFPAGHGDVNVPLILGAAVTLEVGLEGALLHFD